MRKFKNIFGFTLIELMVALAVSAVLYNALATYYFQNAQAERDRANANLHKIVAKAYANYITDNYASILTLIGGGSIGVLKYTALPPNYKTGINIPTGFMPCTIILKEGGILYPLIVDVTGSAYTPGANAAAAITYLGDYAAFLDSGIFKSDSGWNIDTATSPYFGSGVLASCDFPSLVQNSLAINLAQAPFFIQPFDNISLNRVQDTSSVGVNNNNVDKTDIIMAYGSGPTTYNGFYFTENSTLPNIAYLASGLSTRLSTPYRTTITNGIVAESASLVAQSFIPMPANAVSPLSPLSQCSASSVGQIVLDSTAQTGNNAVADLQCTYDPINCASTANYCYLPMLNSSTTYVAQTSTTFTCPSNSYLDTSVPPVIVPITPTNATTTISGAAIPNCTSWINIGPTSWFASTGSGANITAIRGTSVWIGSSPNTTAGCTSETQYTTFATVVEATCRSITW